MECPKMFCPKFRLRSLNSNFEFLPADVEVVQLLVLLGHHSERVRWLRSGTHPSQNHLFIPGVNTSVA